MALFDVIHGALPTSDDYQWVMIFNYLDPILLIAIVAPILYILIFQPMRNQQDELEVARRKIEQAHREWMAALDVIDDPIFLHDKQFRILRCNKAYQQRAGIPFPEIIGQPYYEIFPKTGAPLPCCLRALGKEEEAEEAEELAVGEANYRSRAFSIKDEQGVYLYSMHILEDITERKNAEDKLAKSEQHFRAVTESANDAIITGAGAGNIVGWNAAAGRVFGYTEAEIIGQPLTVLMPERFRNLHRAGLARVVAGGTPHVIGKTVELAGLRKDGSEFPLEFSLAQWQAAEGQFFTAIIRDITERKRAEDSLRKLSLAVEQSPNSIVITDLDANIEYANAAFVKATGYSLAEAIGQNPRLLHSGKTPRATYDDLWAHLTRGELWKGEFINRRKDGSEYIESVLISPVRGDDGRVTNYLAIKEDITEHKRIESDLGVNRTELEMQNEELRRAQIALEESRDQFVDLYEFSPVGY